MTLDKIVDKIAEGTTEMNRDAIEKQIIERVKNSIGALGIKTKSITKGLFQYLKKENIPKEYYSA